MVAKPRRPTAAAQTSRVILWLALGVGLHQLMGVARATSCPDAPPMLVFSNLEQTGGVGPDADVERERWSDEGELNEYRLTFQPDDSTAVIRFDGPEDCMSADPNGGDSVR
jgi:hypothetical protein